MMDYATWLVLVELITDQISLAFTALDSVALVEIPSGYYMTMLDVIIVFWLAEELWSFVMEI